MSSGHSEQERLEELQRTQLLDSEPEESFDSLTRLASRLLNVPIVQVNLITSDRQFTKSMAGTIDLTEVKRSVPIEHSICRYTVQSGKPLHVPNTLRDPLFNDNPVVVQLQCYSYLGIPIITKRGYTIGTLCVIDHRTREWSDEEREILSDLAQALSSQIDMRMEIDRTNSRFQSLVENSYDVTTLIDPFGVITYQSPSIAGILGYDVSETLGIPCFDLIHPDDVSTVQQKFNQLVQTPLGNITAEYRIRNKAGCWIWVESTGRNLLDDTEIASLLINTRDVSERKDLEQYLTYQAHHDALTGLGNRQRLLDCLDSVFASDLPSDTPLILLILDLNRFKSINDLFGHMEGDHVLKLIARRIMRATNGARCVARLGGDEFAILYTHRPCEEAESIAWQLGHEINDLPVTGGKSIPVTCCIGVTSSLSGESSLEELLKTADLALLSAKQSTGSPVAVYRPDIRDSVLDRIQLEADLRGIIDRDELVVHFQPIVYLETGMVTGVEALARWQHPTRGLISPDTFIPLAEESGLIREIGAEVLRKTCQEVIRWDAVSGVSFQLKVGMNISATELTDPELMSTIQATLQEFDLQSNRFVLEITESTAVSRSELVRYRLDELRSLGIVLAVDDFGTGYSSLAYLTRLPFDILKIDRTFIQDLGSIEANRKILLTIVNLAEHLGLDVVAEGVETVEQLAMIRSLNFKFLQGYYVARPMPADDFFRFYTEHSASVLVPPWEAE